MQETAQILREAAQGTSEAFDRANRGWDYYIRDIERVRHEPSGAQFNTDRRRAAFKNKSCGVKRECGPTFRPARNALLFRFALRYSPARY